MENEKKACPVLVLLSSIKQDMPFLKALSLEKDMREKDD